ncbi:MAG: protein translocase subunit SecF [Minisyncoccia bacterium]
MNIIKYKKIFLGISLILVLTAASVVGVKGLDYGIEFTGGSVMEVSYASEKPAVETLRAEVATTNIDAQIQPFGEMGYIIKTGFLTENERITLSDIATQNSGTVERFNSIGPSVGKELRTKSLYALILVSLGIVLFVAYAFRHVSEPVSSWRYGVVAVIALLHDLIIPVGILTLLGTEIDTLYVVGLLSILGLSVNDTIVVFDRIRDGIAEKTSKTVDFDTTVGHAVNDTIARSVFTSLTLVVVLLALYFAGPVATRTLSLVLLLGTIVGTYSSIFLASPLLTYMVSKKENK